MKNNVYHGSYVSDLKILEPKSVVRGASYLYAAKDISISVVFMTNKKKNTGDLTYWKGRNPETGKVAIVERYAGAFNDLYDGISGSIYVLSGETFVEGKTQWCEEVVSEAPVQVLQEIKIKNIHEYLNNLEKQGELEIYRYPSRPGCVPENDRDLIIHAMSHSKIPVLKRLHPQLFEKLKNFLDH